MLYCFSNVGKVKPWQIKLIPYFILVSWLLDLTWMIMYTGDYWGRQKYDGDVELNLRRFVLLSVYFSFLFRILVFLVFLKILLSDEFLHENYAIGGKDYTPPKRVFRPNI